MVITRCHSLSFVFKVFANRSDITPCANIKISGIPYFATAAANTDPKGKDNPDGRQLNRRTELEVLGSDFEGNIKYKRVSGEEDAKGPGSLFEGRTGGDDK